MATRVPRIWMLDQSLTDARAQALWCLLGSKDITAKRLRQPVMIQKLNKQLISKASYVSQDVNVYSADAEPPVLYAENDRIDWMTNRFVLTHDVPDTEVMVWDHATGQLLLWRNGPLQGLKGAARESKMSEVFTEVEATRDAMTQDFFISGDVIKDGGPYAQSELKSMRRLMGLETLTHDSAGKYSTWNLEQAHTHIAIRINEQVAQALRYRRVHLAQMSKRGDAFGYARNMESRFLSETRAIYAWIEKWATIATA